MPTEVLVDRDGYSVTDSEGYELDQSCIEACCEGGPADCCPSPCGKRFVVCVAELHVEIAEFLEIIEGGSGRLVVRFMGNTVADLIDGPQRISGWTASPGTEGGCSAVGRLAVRIVRVGETESDFVPRGHAGSIYGFAIPEATTRTIEDQCWTYGQKCPGDGEGRDIPIPLAQSPFLESTLVNFPSGLPFGTSSGTIAPQCTPGPTGITTTTHSIDWRLRSSSESVIEERIRVESTAHAVVLQGPGPAMPNCGTARSWTFTTVRMRFTVKAIEGCEDPANTLPPCDGREVTECEGEQAYLEGIPCRERAGVPPAPRVFWPIGNVTGCDTLKVGDRCYKIKPTNPILRVTGQPPGVVDPRVVDGTHAQTCCECMADCGAVRLGQASPCWVNARRDQITDHLIIEPAAIANAVCCCRDDDIITIQTASGDLDWADQGLRQRWRLRGPIRFRRDDPDPLHGRQLISDVFDFEGNHITGPGGFAHGLFDNGNPLPCGWGGSLGAGLRGTAFPLLTPQEGLVAQPVASGGGANLPCARASDDEVNGWEVVRQNLGIDCRTFDFTAEYRRRAGRGVGTFSLRLWITITPSAAAELDRCGGGCGKAANAPGDPLAARASLPPPPFGLTQEGLWYTAQRGPGCCG